MSCKIIVDDVQERSRISGKKQASKRVQDNIPQKVVDITPQKTYGSKYDAYEDLYPLLEKMDPDPEVFLSKIYHGQFSILFENGTEEEKVLLELISCNVNNLKREDQVNHWLPKFYDKNELNRIVQVTENGVKQVDTDDVGSYYSVNYDSEASNQSFDQEECEDYYPSDDEMKTYRPINYSFYLKSEGVERNAKLKAAVEIVHRKKDFIRSLTHHSSFIWIACNQKIYPVHDNFHGYVCPW